VKEGGQRRGYCGGVVVALLAAGTRGLHFYSVRKISTAATHTVMHLRRGLDKVDDVETAGDEGRKRRRVHSVLTHFAQHL
jgi:hypothetical protein